MGFLSIAMLFFQDWVITESPASRSEIVVTETTVISQDAPQKPWVVMFTASWCGPCQSWKNSSKPSEIRSAGYQIVYVDIDREPKWKKAGKKLPAVERYPTFWVVDPATKLPIKTWTGSVSVFDVLSVAKDDGKKPSRSEKRMIRRTKSDIESWIRRNYSSSDNLKTTVNPASNVWNHLVDGTSGTHVFTREQINGLELWIALALHDAVHSGRLTPFVD